MRQASTQAPVCMCADLWSQYTKRAAQDPNFRGRQAVTFHNQRDFIFVRCVGLGWCPAFNDVIWGTVLLPREEQRLTILQCLMHAGQHVMIVALQCM